MNTPHWIDKHFTSPDERAAKIKAEAEAARRDSRGRVLRLVFLKIPLLLAAVAILGAGTAAALNYYGVVDLTAYAPRLPRKAPAVAVPAPVQEAAPAGAQDLSALILAPYDTARPISSPIVPEPVAAPEPAQPVGQPATSAHAQHIREGIAMMGRELTETDRGIAGLKAALSTRPGVAPYAAPWTDMEHLLTLEWYAQAHPRMSAAEGWDWKNAHDAWVTNVGNDRKRLADLTAKRASIAVRQDKAKAELGQ